MSKLDRWEATVKKNMQSAERDYQGQPENLRGFVIGAAQQLWDTHKSGEMTEIQFDRLISLLEGFANGAYRDLIRTMVEQYKRGDPPLIIGY